MEANRKESEIVMLPTDKTDGMLWETTSGQLIHTHVSGKFKTEYKPFNLYFTSDEDIKEGDWLIWNDKVYKHSKTSFTGIDFSDCKKIIATTDPELYTLNWKNGILLNTHIVHQLPQAFIERFCKVGGIWKVMVEYNKPVCQCDTVEKMYDCPFNLGGVEDSCEKPDENNDFYGLRPKVDSHNEITIPPLVEKMYSRDEVEQLCRRAYEDGFDEGTKTDSPCKDPVFWIEEKL